MISIPDDLLVALDRRARERATTRSGLLQELARREVEHDDEARRRRILELLANGPPHGGDSARWIRMDRDRDNR